MRIFWAFLALTVVGCGADDASGMAEKLQAALDAKSEQLSKAELDAAALHKEVRGGRGCGVGGRARACG